MTGAEGVTAGTSTAANGIRLHVVGCRRSGTTLLFELLSTCFAHDEACEHERSIFDSPCPPGLSLSKKPSDVTHVRAAFEADPNLYLLYVLRDPRSVVTSIHPSRPNIYFASFERWLRYEAAATPMKRHPRFLEVRYEELVRDPLGVQQRIGGAFPFLSETHPFTEFAEHAQTAEPAAVSLLGVRPIETESRERWRQHLPRLRFQMQQYPELATVIREYGYESSDAWLAALDGVAAAPQGYGERPRGRLARMEAALRYWFKTRRYLRRARARAGQ